MYDLRRQYDVGVGEAVWSNHDGEPIGLTEENIYYKHNNGLFCTCFLSCSTTTTRVTRKRKYYEETKVYGTRDTITIDFSPDKSFFAVKVLVINPSSLVSRRSVFGTRIHVFCAKENKLLYSIDYDNPTKRPSIFASPTGTVCLMEQEWRETSSYRVFLAFSATSPSPATLVPPSTPRPLLVNVGLQIALLCANERYFVTEKWGRHQAVVVFERPAVVESIPKVATVESATTDSDDEESEAGTIQKGRRVCVIKKALGERNTVKNWRLTEEDDYLVGITRAPAYLKVFDVRKEGEMVFCQEIPNAMGNKNLDVAVEFCGLKAIRETVVAVGRERQVDFYRFSRLEFPSLFPLCAAFFWLPPYVILLLFDTSEALRKGIRLEAEERWMHGRKIGLTQSYLHRLNN